ncbi:MAG: hypothetical protein K2K91_05130 [Ruminococcus sp.]|nr:hypothetical protein [Ruminococcus sp.]
MKKKSQKIPAFITSCVIIIGTVVSLAYIRKINLEKIYQKKYEEHMQFHEKEKELYKSMIERRISHE